MSIQEQRRKAFEAWAVERRFPIHRDGVVVTYSARCTDEAWQAWNAALDSVVIEMPEHCWLDVGMIDSVRCFEAEDVEDAIKAAGLKVKP